MENAKLRIGAEINGSILKVEHGFDVYFRDFESKFVEIVEYWPWQRDRNNTWNGALGHLHAGKVDTLTWSAVFTSERLNAFKYTNPCRYANYAAVYAAQANNAINFKHITANISLLWYLLFMAATVSFILLLVLFRYTFPTFTPTFSLFKTVTAAIPCIRQQTSPLQHLNSVTRAAVLVLA
jgi:hypothetical protein